MPRGTYGNVFCASMTSGLVYSLVTMPFETAKNLMAFQKPDARGALDPGRQAATRRHGRGARVARGRRPLGGRRQPSGGGIGRNFTLSNILNLIQIMILL